jgi:hypothetical protein
MADGAHIFVGDEIGTGNWTRAFNVEDPHDVEQVADLIVNPSTPVHNCNVEGDLLYIAHYSLGVRVWDVSDPANPFEVAYYDTYPGTSSGYNGNWSVYPYLPSGRIIASDMSGGLFVLQLDLPAALVPEIEPVGGPIVIPATGGPFTFTAALTNPGAQSQTVDAWVVARLPNGNLYNRPLVGPRTLTLGPGQTLGPLSFTESVPASAPPGVYTVELRVGDYPSGVDASDSFTLTKLAPALASATGVEASFATYPNPFTDRTTVRFTLTEAADVRLVVYDALGREAAVLVDGYREAGPHEAAFDGTGLPNGTYFALLEAAGRVERQTLTLLR